MRQLLQLATTIALLYIRQAHGLNHNTHHRALNSDLQGPDQSLDFTNTQGAVEPINVDVVTRQGTVDGNAPVENAEMMPDPTFAPAISTFANEADLATSKRVKALLVDGPGPNRSEGEGLRVMGMISDLLSKDCNYEVHVLTDCDGCRMDSFLWEDPILSEYKDSVFFWGYTWFSQHGPNYDEFDKIIIGGKLNILASENATHVVKSVLKDLAASPHREKTWGFWDDVPFKRCEYRSEEGVCDRVPELAREFAAVSTGFYTLTSDDRDSMMEHMAKHQLRNVKQHVWPMRLNDLAQLVPPSTSFSLSALQGKDAVESKTFLTMMGNTHPVNKLNVEALFTNGTVQAICDEIRERDYKITILFLGTIAAYAQGIQAGMPDQNAFTCVEYKEGYVSNKELERNVWPRTRAVLNPFFFDVLSGVSVKSFESIKNRMPLVTSKYGLHGLGELDECNFPVPVDASPKAFTDFVIDTVLPVEKYISFATSVNTAAKICTDAQSRQFPLNDYCKAS